MSCTDVVVPVTYGHCDRAKHDPDPLSAGGSLKSTAPEQFHANGDATAPNAQRTPSDGWMDLPAVSSRESRASKEHRRRKTSRSHFRSSSTVSSSAASSKGKRSRKLRESQERTGGKKKREPPGNVDYKVEYKSSRERPSLLYRSPHGNENGRIKRLTSKAAPSQDRVRTLVSPSLLSVLSALTGVTESSSGSNTTVTQKSYDWTQGPVESSRRHARDISRASSRAVRASERPRLSRGPSRDAIDVFRFLEKDSTEQNILDQSLSRSPPSGSLSRVENSNLSHTHAPTTLDEQQNSTLTTKNAQDETVYSELLHSDSGVSVGGDSPEFRRRTTMHYKPPSIESTPEVERFEEKPKAPGPVDDLPYYDVPYQDGANPLMMGPPYPTEGLSGQQTLTPSPRPLGYSLYEPAAWTPPPVDASKMKSTITGYELLASKLSGIQMAKDQKHDFIVPLYRRFEPLHHRVLLHIQDEISELEEQLRQLDECIAQSQAAYEGVVRPASRREDLRFGDSLRYQRTDLLGRICMKLNTYSQALKSYSMVTQNTEDAQENEISMYKEWLQQHQPIAKPESDFLEHGTDLMRISSASRRLNPENETLSARRGISPADSITTVKPAASGKWAIAGPPAALLLTFVAFVVIPTLFGRLVVLSILAGIGYVLLHLAKVDEWMTGREVACFMGIYVGVMATIAAALQ